MATTALRKFSAWEQEIIEHFCAAKSSECKRIEDLLCSFYFKELEGRALIIQSKSRYAVFFLSIQAFNDDQKKKEELDKFLEMISLVRWLKEQGYISLFRGTASNEKIMHFLQDGFQNAHPSSGTIFLNARGDNTSSPDTIHDKAQNIIYKGMVFDNDTYEMILTATTGNLYVSHSLIELNTGTGDQPEITDKNMPPKNANTTQNNAAAKTVVSVPVAEPKETQTNNESKKTSPTETIINLVRKQENKKNTTFLLISTGFIFLISMGLFAILLYRVNRADARINTISRNTDSLLNNWQTGISQKKSGNIIVNTVADTAAYYYGIDVSHWNGNIMNDINYVDSLSFAICKATEGATATDPDYESNAKLIRSKGLIRGKYHFYLVNDDPLAQAEHFYKVATPLDSLDMPLIVDIEDNSLSKRGGKTIIDIQNELLQFLDRVQQLSGRMPIIYTDLDFANEYLNDQQFAKYELWLAEYSNSCKPEIPTAWAKTGCKIWQRSKRLDINSFVVDYDIYYGIKQALYDSQ